MKDSYLEVTYRHGKPLAAYLYLPRQNDDRADHTQEREPGILVDYAADGRPIGVEITAPSRLTLETLNRVLTSLHQLPMTASDLAPLAA